MSKADLSLAYWLATAGIPAFVGEVEFNGHEPDPWLPKTDGPGVQITIDEEGAGRLVAILRGRLIQVLGEQA